jgi:hypothetical protein
MAAQLSVHVEHNFRRNSIPHSRVRWSETGRVGKRSASSAVGGLQARCEAATLAIPGPVVLDGPEDDLERLENGFGDCSARTVLRWHRRRFKHYWSQLSHHKNPGRPRTNAEIRNLSVEHSRIVATGVTSVHQNPQRNSSGNHFNKIEFSYVTPVQCSPTIVRSTPISLQ